VIGVGTDIVEIRRIERALERHGERFLERILVPEELRACRESAAPARFLAKRFAAKEAVSKALGTGIGLSLSWQDLKVEREPGGAPRVVLSQRGAAVLARRGGREVLLSVSDERAYAVAFAVVLA
jgi:holo-[acyl-carrier protein] synthase